MFRRTKKQIRRRNEYAARLLAELRAEETVAQPAADDPIRRPPVFRHVPGPSSDEGLMELEIDARGNGHCRLPAAVTRVALTGAYASRLPFYSDLVTVSLLDTGLPQGTVIPVWYTTR